MIIKDKKVIDRLYSLNKFLYARNIKTKSIDELISYLLDVENHYCQKNGYYRKEE